MSHAVVEKTSFVFLRKVPKPQKEVMPTIPYSFGMGENEIVLNYPLRFAHIALKTRGFAQTLGVFTQAGRVQRGAQKVKNHIRNFAKRHGVAVCLPRHDMYGKYIKELKGMKGKRN